MLLTPDSESIKRFWRILHQRTGRSLGDLANTTGVQVYGSIGDIAIERTRHSAGSAATGRVLPRHVGGFTRLVPAGGPSLVALGRIARAGDQEPVSQA